MFFLLTVQHLCNNPTPGLDFDGKAYAVVGSIVGGDDESGEMVWSVQDAQEKDLYSIIVCPDCEDVLPRTVNQCLPSILSWPPQVDTHERTRHDI